MDWLIQLDHSLFLLINQTWSAPWADIFFPFITDLSKQLWFKVTVYPGLLALYLYKYKKKGVLYFVGFFLTLGVTDFTGNKVFKKNVERPRPFQTEGLKAEQRSPAKGTSFISNHSSNMFAFATYTTVFFPASRYIVFTMAALIAYSRVYNGVHFPLDIFCGALWGISVALIMTALIRKLEKRFNL